MGNSQSNCQEEAPSNESVRVGDLLADQSTQAAGADATNLADEDDDHPGEEEEASPGDNQDDAGGEGEEEPTKTIVLHTTPLDPRFPSANAARQCYTLYNEYHKCLKQRGEGSKECDTYARNYRSICPQEWIENWNTLREEGRWFGKY